MADLAKKCQEKIASDANQEKPDETYSNKSKETQENEPKNIDKIENISDKTKNDDESQTKNDNKNKDVQQKEIDRIQKEIRELLDNKENVSKSTENIQSISSSSLSTLISSSSTISKNSDTESKTESENPKEQEKNKTNDNEKIEPTVKLDQENNNNPKAQDIGKVNLDEIKKKLAEADKFENDFSSIQGGVHILNTISRNIDVIKNQLKNHQQYGKIRGILIYEHDGEYLDYWGKLKFKKENEKYIDDTGYFEGELCGSFEEITEKGILTPNGFFQNKKLSTGELGAQFTTIKLLIEEISHEKGKSIRELLQENNDISITDRLIFAHSYKDTLKNKQKDSECVKVCVCADSFCKEPCKEIRCVNKKDLM
ncbi:hypothetical protein GVAV_000273 [Gurleya vavrai]